MCGLSSCFLLSPLSSPACSEYWDPAVFSVVVVAQWECENL